MRVNRLIVVTLTLIVSSCTIFQPVQLPLPSESIQKPSEQSLECLDMDAYKIIVKAYRRVDTLERIIKSTH